MNEKNLKKILEESVKPLRDGLNRVEKADKTDIDRLERKLDLHAAKVVDFGELQPDICSAILNPKQLWSLLPLSN